MRKTILIAVVAALLASLPCLAAAPSLPPGTPQPAGTVAAAAGASLPALAGCGQTLGVVPALELRGTSVRVGEAVGPVCPLAVDGVQPSSKPFHGFCACSCTFVPDCNTSADCGGSSCLARPTCC
jgi:hypothetical protein